jgi:HK97 family phage prohead protease
MLPDNTENTIRVGVKEPGLFAEDSFPPITVSDERGIKAVIGKLKGDPGESTHIQTYLFDKSKWTVSEAEKWVSEHKKQSGLEKRSFDAGLIGYSKEDHNTIHLRGLAIPYNRLSDNPLPGFSSSVKERILPGAFTKSISSGRDIMMLWNHELKYIFGRTSKATLQLNEGADGVSFLNVPPESIWAKDLLPSIKRGDYSNMSFSFKDDKDPDWTLENGEYVRNVREATLFEISLVPFAVYETTSIGMRSAEFMIVDWFFLPDPSFQHKKVEAELKQFMKTEEQFNKLKEQWLK